MLAAALLMFPAATPALAAPVAPPSAPEAGLLARYSKVKTSSKVEGAKAVLQKKVESAKSKSANAPKAKAATASSTGQSVTRRHASSQEVPVRVYIWTLHVCIQISRSTVSSLHRHLITFPAPRLVRAQEALARSSNRSPQPPPN